MADSIAKDLLDIIDSRKTEIKQYWVGTIVSVEEGYKKATVTLPDSDIELELLNKSNDKLTEGDSVYILSPTGDLTNAFILATFGESVRLVAGEDIEIADDSIGQDELADDSVGEDQIQDGAVGEDQIADFSVTNAKIENATITNAKIQDAAITTAKIGYAQITTAKIGEAQITTSKIQDAAITNAKIENLAVDNAKIAVAAIDTANIKNAAITTACIGDAAITTTQIADGSVTDAKIVDLTADKITAGTLDAGVITVVNLNAANITVGKINGVQIEDGAIGIAQLDDAVNSLISTSHETADGKNTIWYNTEEPDSETYTFTEGDTWFDTDDGYKMYSWDGSAWIAMPLGTGAIDDSAITAAQLVDGTITGVKLADGAVTAREIATGAIIADKIAVGAVTTNAIEAKAITATQIDSNTITADKLLLGDASNYANIWTYQYTLDDLVAYTGRTFYSATKSGDYVLPEYPASATTLLLSLPWDISALSTTDTDNGFGFEFISHNSYTEDVTASLFVYSFNSDKEYISSQLISTFTASVDSEVVDENGDETWQFEEDVTRVENAEYFVFAIEATSASGYPLMFKDIQARKSIGGTFIADGSITTNKIVAEAITTDKLAARSILATNIAANTITAGEIAAGAITADELAANSVTAMKIKAGEITTDHIASNFGETLDISSNSSITLMVTQDDIDEVTDHIVSYINLNPEGITINAANVNLSGYCTFTTAQSLADSAESDATTAGYNYAMGVKNGLGTSGYTTINGSNITTGVLNANLITTGTLSANRIASSSITADKIKLEGYISSDSKLKINSNGVVYLSELLFYNGSSSGIWRDGFGDMQVFCGTGSVYLRGTNMSKYVYVQGLRASTQPYNIPMTTTSSSTKITEIAHFSTYLNVTCNGSNYGVYYTVSDKRLKTDIKASKINALDRLNSAKIRDFNWIKDGSNVDCGVIAQEVEQDVGERYVLKVPQPNGGVNYQVNSYEFMPLIVKGIQELNEKHEEKTAQLTNEIAILKQICEQQQQQINELKALIA